MLDLSQTFNPIDSDFHAVAEAAIAEAHQLPVFFSPNVDAWVVSRYSDVDEVLKSPERFSSKDIISIADLISPEVSAYFGDFIPMEGTLIGLDEPVHSRLRRVLNHAFTPERINALAPRVTSTINGILDEVVPEGHMELQSTLSFPMALTTIASLIGISPEDTRDFRVVVQSWEALALAYMSGVPLEEQLALAKIVVDGHLRINELLDDRRHNPQEDLLSDIVACEESESLTPKELLSLVPGLFLAGHRTTGDALGLGTYHLLTPRTRYEALVADPTYSPAFVEELLRFDGPVFGLWRHVLEDSTIGGTLVPAGAKLYVSFWGANLDDARFALANDLDTNRSNPKLHLAFGRGIHHCIGAPLGRLELRLALERLATRLPGLDLASGFTPTWAPNFFLRGLNELQLVW